MTTEKTEQKTPAQQQFIEETGHSGTQTQEKRKPKTPEINESPYKFRDESDTVEQIRQPNFLISAEKPISLVEDRAAVLIQRAFRSFMKQRALVF